MKRMAFAALLVIAVVISVAPSSHAGSRRGPEVDVFIGVGPTYRYAPPPYYVYPPAPVYVAPPPVVYSSPPVVLPPPPPAYWYFCRSYGAYYPSVPSCPEAWQPVPAR